MNAIIDFLDNFSDVDAQNSWNGRDVKNYRLLATIPYLLPILFALPYNRNNCSEYCCFHSSQQLAWFIITLVMWIVILLLKFIGVTAVIGWILGILWIIGAAALTIGAYNDLALRVPLIGRLTEIF